MVIFGWKQTAKELGALFSYCGSCGQPGWQRIYQRMTWLTLFFVPVLPLRSTRALLCGTCGAQSKLTKPQAAALVARAYSHDQHPAYGPHQFRPVRSP
jgi:hypothetical protein